MKGKVLKNKLLIKQDAPEQQTEKGIILPGSYTEPPKKGVVIVSETEEIDPGDRVVFAEHAGTPVILDEPDMELSGEYLLLDIQHVLFFKKS